MQHSIQIYRLLYTYITWTYAILQSLIQQQKLFLTTYAQLSILGKNYGVVLNEYMVWGYNRKVWQPVNLEDPGYTSVKSSCYILVGIEASIIESIP